MLVGPQLPNETKRKIADLLLRSCDADLQNPTERTLALMRDVTQGPHPHFDDWLPELIVTLNPAPREGQPRPP